MALRNKMINFACILIMGLAFILFWFIFLKDSKGNPMDLLPSVQSFLQDFLLLLIFLVLAFFGCYYFREELQYPLLLSLHFLGLLKPCKFCQEYRDEPVPYLVDGYCGNCNTPVCKACFDISNTKKQAGCPVCGGNTFKRDRRLGYPFYCPKDWKSFDQDSEKDRIIQRSDKLVEKSDDSAIQ